MEVEETVACWIKNKSTHIQQIGINQVVRSRIGGGSGGYDNNKEEGRMKREGIFMSITYPTDATNNVSISVAYIRIAFLFTM